MLKLTKKINGKFIENIFVCICLKESVKFLRKDESDSLENKFSLMRWKIKGTR